LPVAFYAIDSYNIKSVGFA